MSLVGIRVVRGPHWKWNDQDRGEGNLGTVCEELDDVSQLVIVKWDQGTCNNYRAGHENQYDLRIFDNSYLGVIHNSVCKGCNIKSIIGMKYRCSTCKCYDLCTSCYHNNKHNVTHVFTVFPTNTSIGINLPSRMCSKKAKLRYGSTYYYDHLPLLGKNYEKIVKTDTKNEAEQIQNLEKAKHCIGCNKPSSENVTFEPCNHKLACIDCSELFTICMICRVPIKKRISVDSKILPNPEEARLRKLEDVLHKLEELYFCGICSEYVANTLFICGHKVCESCSERLSTCHMCRKLISLRLTI
ncbi:PREDICTED: E3 ubiquitin-protein ligase MIB1 [Nicrophorus vespilloides]|uniref:E3 ubiquitin-protein ligase MIB1 n=1 Tax=Nicrophorus vespilloides TaxID=110193 RepID=A0ABM1MLP3_NICVS|nr:PREDICTED: E3 ubiquitin-protein ligase MIB1 [Nicrophorus vespilloides]